MTVRMQQKKIAYTFDYPVAVEAAEKQRSIFWTPDEIDVEKDIQDLKVNLTEAEAHGVITTLKLFTMTELVAGNEYWGKRVMRMFPRPDINMMANAFSFFELNVHAPFYNAINEALMLNTDEFYLSYLDTPVLADRMAFIEAAVTSKDDLLSLSVFTMVEGCSLYSAFGFLLHFQAKGKNKIKNICSGIKFSTRDENLHSEGGAWLFKTLVAEKQEAGEISTEELASLLRAITEASEQLRQHEYAVVDMIFEKGEIEGVNKQQLKDFVDHRIAVCLSNLGMPTADVPSVIKDYFYDMINAPQYHDFFAGIGSEYNRDWNEQGFKW